MTTNVCLCVFAAHSFCVSLFFFLVESNNSSSSTPSSSLDDSDTVLTAACGTIDNDDDDDDEEEMFVQPHESLGLNNQVEWGGPTRGGRLLEPTRFGDWERKVLLLLVLLQFVLLCDFS